MRLSEITITSTDVHLEDGVDDVEHTVVVDARTTEGVELRAAVLLDGSGDPIQHDAPWDYDRADNVETAVGHLAREHGWTASRRSLIEAEIREAAQAALRAEMDAEMD